VLIMLSDFSTVEVAVDAIARGGVVIVLDAWDRENEGDFMAASELITAETVNLMITYGRGHLCQSVLPSTARRIDVQPLVTSNDSTAPRFAMPVDARVCTTGISPVDRALTIRSIVDESTTAADFVRPGHIFPLIAEEHGVLARQGHTEAGIDLTRMAELTPSAVLCEICSRDGRNMAHLDELRELAHELNLPIVTIDSLAEYRQYEAKELPLARLARDLAGDVREAATAHGEERVAQVGRVVTCGDFH
jgi:3,4-dihydroxy 2-butanone 4-phosphate synthase/GTP cyclohydrolase II